MLKLREILEKVITNLFKHLASILIFHVTRSNVKCIVWTEVFIIFMFRHLVINFNPKCNSSLSDKQFVAIDSKRVVVVEKNKSHRNLITDQIARAVT